MAANMTPIPANMSRIALPPAKKPAAVPAVPMSKLPVKVVAPPPEYGVDPALAAQLVARGQTDKLKELTATAAKAKAKSAVPTNAEAAKAFAPLLPVSATKEILNFAKETVAAPVRAAISVGLGAPMRQTRGDAGEILPVKTPTPESRPTFTPKNPFLKELLNQGDAIGSPTSVGFSTPTGESAVAGPAKTAEPIKSVQTRIAESKTTGETLGEKFGGEKGKKFGAFAGPAFVLGSTALDLTPFAGLEEGAAKTAAKEGAEALGKKKLVEAFLKSGEGAQAVAAREAKIAEQAAAREGMNLSSKVEEGIKANPVFKKEKTVTDAMSTGWLLEKDGKHLVVPAEDVQAQVAKGWAPKIEVDSLASEAGFENPMSYLEAHVQGPPKVPTVTEMAADAVDKGWRPATEAVAPGAAKLPPALSKSAPRYGYGSEQYKLTFASDIDKAAYIAANRAKTSGADAAFLDFVKENTGWTDEQVFAHGNQVKAGIKDQVVSGKDLSSGIINVSEVKPALSTPIAETALEGARTAAPGGDASIAATVPPAPPGLKSGPSVGAAGDLERGFVTNVKASKKTAPEVAEAIQGEYRQVSNKETLAAGIKLAEENSDEVLSVLDNPKLAFTKDHAAAVMHMADQAQAAGKYTEATSLLERAAKRATEAGQTGQAFAIWGRLTPAGALKYAQQLVEKAKLANPGLAKLSIPDAVAKEIVQLATDASKFAEGSREKIVATAKLLDKTASVVPPSILRKISTLQTMAQLLNPKTIIRNLFGNAGFSVFENVSDLVGAAIDAPLSLVTGKRSLALPSLAVQGKGLARGWKLGLEDAVKGIDTMGSTGKFGEIAGQRGKTFTSGVLGKMETAMNIALKGPDRAFYQAAFDGTVDNMLRLSGKTTLAEVPEKLANQILETAHFEALRRTFQDNSAVAKVLTGLKKILNLGKEFGVGDAVIKYPKTPGNIITRGIEYSPLGFADALFKLAAPVIGKVQGVERVFDQRAFIQATSRALVGTAGLVGTGALLHKLGLISTKSDAPAKAAATEQAAGLRNYQINVSGLKRFVMSGFDPKEANLREGDKLTSYDWFQPAAIGLAMGADIDKSKGTKGGVVGGILDFVKNGGAIDALAASANTVAEQPAFTGIKRYLGDASRNGGLGKTARDLISDVPASFIPTFLNQIRQLTDRTERDATNKNVFTEAVDKVKGRIPGLASQVPERFDVFGKPINYYESKGIGRIADVFTNPMFEQTWQPAPEAKLALDLWRNSGSTTGLPPKIDKSQQGWGASWTIDAKDISAMQHYTGLQATKIMGALASNPMFAKLPVEKQQSVLNSAFSSVTGEAKALSYLRSQGVETPTGTDPLKVAKLLDAASKSPAWKKLPPEKRKLILDRIAKMATSPVPAGQ